MRNLKKSLIVAGLLIIAGLAVLFIYTTRQSENPSPNQKSDFECKTFDGEEHCTDMYLGLTEADAIEKARDNKFTAKIKERDGDTGIPNTDLGGRPIFFTVENGIVTKAKFN